MDDSTTAELQNLIQIIWQSADGIGDSIKVALVAITGSSKVFSKLRGTEELGTEGSIGGIHGREPGSNRDGLGRGNNRRGDGGDDGLGLSLELSGARQGRTNRGGLGEGTGSECHGASVKVGGRRESLDNFDE